MNAQSNAVVTHKQPTAIEVLQSNLSKRADEFSKVLPAHIKPEKFQRVIATAAIQNPQLLNCDRQSLLLASMKLAQDGLLPDGREAALVPFKVWNAQTRTETWQVQPMPMVYGLRKKILQSGDVLSIETGVVYLADLETGNFLYEVGLEPPIRYRPNLLLSDEDTADDKIVAAYSIAKLRNEHGGDPYWSVEVMRRAEINKIRETSQTGATRDRKGNARQAKGPWADWFGEMARKTVLRRHSKVLPMSGDILDTIHRDIEEERTAHKAAAESAAAYLSAPTEPLVVPTGQEHAEGETIDGDTGEVIQKDPATGMTQVDEKTARQLDSQGDAGSDVDAEDRANAEHWVAALEKKFKAAKTDAARRKIHDENASVISELEQAYPDLHERAMKAIPAYDDGGDNGQPANDDNSQDAPAADDDKPLDPYRGKPWAEKRRDFLDKLFVAEAKAEVSRIEDEITKIFVSFPEEVQDELETALGEARKRIRSADAQKTEA